MKRTALHLVLALLACLLVLPAGATNQRKVAFGLQGPFDCTLCHGSATTGQYWPDGVGGIPAYVDDSAGAHDSHILAISQYHWGEAIAQLLVDSLNGTSHDKQVTVCRYCHPNPGGAGHTANTAQGEVPVDEPPPVSTFYRDPENRVNVNQDKLNPKGQVERFGKFDGTLVGTAAPFNPVEDLIDGDGDQAYNYVGRNCSNLACHNRMSTPRSSSLPVARAGNWDVPPNMAATFSDGGTFRVGCFVCHGYYGPPRTSTNTEQYLGVDFRDDSHQAHSGRQGSPNDGGVAYPCYQCHGISVSVSGTDDNAAMATGSYYAHGNGMVEIDYSTVTGRTPERIEALAVGGSNGYYAKGGNTNPVVSFPYRSGAFDAPCVNIYCHGGDDATWDRYNYPATDPVLPVWNDYKTGSCGACHGNIGSANSESGRTVYPSSGVASVPIAKITTGSHTDHFKQFDASGVEILDPALAAVWGPRLHPHPGNASGGCYVCHNVSSSCATAVCHGSYNSGQSANVNFSGYNASHADGKVDMSEGGCAQDQANPSPLATTAACDFCHGTNDDGPPEDTGAELAKAEWGTGVRLACTLCHQGTDLATSGYCGGGAVAPVKAAADYENRGHGLDTGSRYPWASGALGRFGAGAVCVDCHDINAVHISGSLADTNRLSIPGNDLCDSCHDGPGSGAAVSQVSTHANTSTTMTNVYTAQRASMQLNCTECHDVHGTANIFMVNEAGLDGPLYSDPSPTPGKKRYYGGVEDTGSLLFNGTVAFTDDSVGSSTTSGVGYADPSTGAGSYASKICQTCHTLTVHYEFDSNDGHVTTDCITCHKHDADDNYDRATSQDGFMPSGCDGCHGYPPVPVGATQPPRENYIGGGGAHQKHVDFLLAKLSIPPDQAQGRYLELCGPCHGETALEVDHNPLNAAAGGWGTNIRAQVNMAHRTADSWDGMAGDPLAAAYGGALLPTKPPAAAVTEANSRCAGVDCHGNSEDAENLHWNVDMSDDAGDADALSPSQVCEGCHDQTPAQVRAYDAAGAVQYTGNAPDAAANYYGTVSGYSRGGHGDAKIQDEDPFIDSGTGTTPIDCTACHDATAAHFPAVGDLNRLGANSTLETSSHTGLCNDCHDNTSNPRYPGEHHPSFRGTSNNATKDIVVSAAAQEIRSAVSGTTSWVDGAGGPCGSGDDFCEQTAYGAANFSGNPDFYVDWWGGNPGSGSQSPPPEPSPFAVLPLLQYVGNQSGPDNTVMCVTCHNPHGTDLFTFDTGGGAEIPDNNMLRLRDSDNTLCNACH